MSEITPSGFKRDVNSPPPKTFQNFNQVSTEIQTLAERYNTPTPVVVTSEDFSILCRAVVKISQSIEVQEKKAAEQPKPNPTQKTL